MKKYLLPILSLVVLLAGCSTDGDDSNNENDSASLVGTWNMTDIRFDDDPNNTTLNLADEIVDVLTEENCFLVRFTFSADGTATADNKVNYLEVNAGPNGLDVPCPTQSDIESTLWSLMGNQLTFINDNQEEETITIQLNENTMIVAGEDIDVNNYSGAEAVFTKE